MRIHELFDVLQVVFSMFDKNGSGTINKKEFRDMSLILIQGEDADENDEFKNLSKLMADSAMAMYDVNKDGKLSFEEWLSYTQHDEDVQGCLSCVINSTISLKSLHQKL